jgi:mono/diheme cytochrome c family protein
MRGLFLALLAGSLVLGLSVLVWLLQPARTPVHLPVGLSSASPGMVERGAYMVRAAGCVACHTDVTRGGKPYAGGRALETPFGTFHAPNITPDAETGIGNWSDADFVRAVMFGEGVNGAHLYPVFPYTSYSRMTLEDVLSIKAYLFSLEPVRSEARANDIAFPFSWRALMRVWKVLHVEAQRPAEIALGRDASWVRGRYLVEGPGHCGECHTPRGLLGAPDRRQSLHGNREGPEGWYVPALDGARAAGFAQWSVEEIDAYLETGEKPDFDSAQGPMKEVIMESTRFLTAEDRRAMAVFLKSLGE